MHNHRTEKRLAFVTMSYLTVTIYAFVSISTVNSQGLTTTSLTTYTGAVSTLNCPIQSSVSTVIWEGPPNSVTYYIGGLGFDPDLPEWRKQRLSVSTNYSLEIISTQLEDSGLYVCTQGFTAGNNQEQAQALQTTLEVRIKAASPVITTSVSADGSKVLATEGQSVTINCRSSGGKPVTTVKLYKGSVDGQTLPGKSSVKQEEDGTYTVDLTYTFIPTRQDDGEQLVCRSFWPTPANAQDSQLVNVTLYLYLLPSQPKVTQTLPVTTGSDVTVQCRTSGSRPAATISWMYQSQTLVPYNTSTQNSSTGTYSTVSFLHRNVTAFDNGRKVLCRAIHLTGNLTGEVTLDVLFPVSPLSTRISGNRVIVANGSNQLPLTCTTGSSNPASTIIWKNERSIINNESPYTRWTGENNGNVTSQVLDMRPTRDENGDTITCSVSNSESSSPVTASIMLELHYQPIVVINSNSNLTINEERDQKSVELSCKIDSNPLSNVTWHHNGKIVKQDARVNSLPYTISSPSRTSYGYYTCMAENGIAPADSKTYILEFMFRPLNVTIIKPGPITVNGTNLMSMSCVTGSSNPAALVTWSTGSIQTSLPVNNNTAGLYGGMVSTSTITFTPTREHDGMTVSCTARNNLFTDQPVSFSTTIDNLRYSPWIGMLTDQTVVEGDNVVLKCKARSKPTASFRWEDNSYIVAQGNGTLSYNGLDYNITSVSRTQAGTYTCIAENQIPPKDSVQARLVVQYPPDVVVTATNTTVHNKSTTLICGAKGVPDQYTYERWVHTFNGVNVTHQHPLPASRELTFTGLSYAHSGVYRCGASNKVKGVVTYDEGTLLVQSVPIITGENPGEIKASGQLMTPILINFQYYSNAGTGSVSVKKKNGTGDEVGEVHQRSVSVQLPVFLSKISTPGTEVTINITVTDENQFGEYAIIVTNEIDPVNLSLIIQPLGPPETPTFVNSTVLNYHSVIISWISGFPNGLNQTFVIQISTDNSTWWNITQNGGMSFKRTHIQRVDNLASSQLYFWRMLAVNGEGESQPTTILNFETEDLPDSNTSPSIGLIAGGAAGGAVTALLVIAIIIFIAWKRRDTSPSGKTTETGVLVMSRNHHQECDEGDEEVENPAYVSAGPREIETVIGASSKKQDIFSDSGNIYAKVNKKPEVVYAMPDKQTDLYAVPDKSKGKKAEKMKQKPSKADKGGKTKKIRNIKTTHQTGCVYENAPSTMFGTKSTPQPEETVYEDTNTATSAAPKRPTGTDGLIYADLEFGPEKTGATTIIGIDERCEYTTIDLTKKAQPLPDSDDEDKTKN